MRKLFIVPLILYSSLQAQPKPGTDALALIHATVIDCTGAPARPDMTVLVTGDRISLIGKTTDVHLQKDAQVVDATGKFLIPGLWDMHGHLTDATETAFPLLIMNGVTGVRDMGGDLDQIDRWRAEIARGTRLGPHIVRAGPFVDGPKPGVKYRLTVTNAAEAREAVRKLKARGVDFIKVHNALSREAFFAVADEAHKQGLPLAVHLPRGISVAEASDAGANSLEHIEILLESALYRKDATAKTDADAIAENSGAAGAAIFARFVKNGTWYVPTLIAYYRGFVLWSDDPGDLQARRAIHLKNLELVQAMHKAGVQIMAGSDFSDWAIVPGVDLHNELALLVEAGFTPMEALQSATEKPAEFLGKLDSLGTIEIGKIADMVLLDANPLEDISHTRKINSVVLGGKLIPIAALSLEALQDVGQRAARHR